MSFSSERVIYCLDDQFQYCLLIGYIKTIAVVKRQQFERSESHVTEPKSSKRPFMNTHNNEERQDSEDHQDKSGRYISLLPYPQKELNSLTDLGKRIKSPNHLIYISKLPNQIIANFVFKFSSRKGSKASKNNLY